MATKVIFRKFVPGGDVIALFPQEPGTADLWTCSSYMHVGQHGAASVAIVDDTEPADGVEYADLLAELKRIGYDDLHIALKFSRKDQEIRRQKLHSGQ